MTRLAIVIVLLIPLTGCLAALPASSSSKDSATFSTGLKNLEKNGDTALLKNLAGKKGESAWGNYSNSVLKIYSIQAKKIKSLQKKNASLNRKNKKLQDNLDKLNQINLELEKRTN